MAETRVVTVLIVKDSEPPSQECVESQFKHSDMDLIAVAPFYDGAGGGAWRKLEEVQYEIPALSHAELASRREDLQVELLVSTVDAAFIELDLPAAAEIELRSALARHLQAVDEPD
jgi:hypothetical protein